MTKPTIVYNLHGDNPRVNINSQDYSINQKDCDALFKAMADVIQTAIEDVRLKEELQRKAREMQGAIGGKSFAQRYAEFVALAANHMTILGPFIPALTQFLK